MPSHRPITTPSFVDVIGHLDEEPHHGDGDHNVAEERGVLVDYANYVHSCTAHPGLRVAGTPNIGPSRSSPLPKTHWAPCLSSLAFAGQARCLKTLSSAYGAVVR